MSDPLTPPISLLCKLGSAVVHADEMLSSDGHAFDRAALVTCLNDAEVKGWIAAMQKQALVPVRRKP